MFDLSAEKIAIILIVALVVLGPGRLAESARALGRARAQLRQFTGGLSPDTANLIRNPRGALFDALAEPRQMLEDTANAARQSVSMTAVDEPVVVTADQGPMAVAAEVEHSAEIVHSAEVEQGAGMS